VGFALGNDCRKLSDCRRSLRVQRPITAQCRNAIRSWRCRVRYQLQPYRWRSR